MTKSHVRTSIAAVLLAGATLGVAASPAAAHVTVSSTDATAGGYGLLTFRVPSESAKANTTGLTIRVPAAAGVKSVRAQPIPGWKSTIKTGAKGDATVTFTATGKGLGPDEFTQFQLLAGPLPKAETLALPAVQKYSDGTRVEWSQQATGDAEPERPAPTLKLTRASAAGTDAHGNVAGQPGADAESGSNSQPGAGSESESSGAGSALAVPGLALGIIGAVLGLAGLVVGAVALRRSRR